ncbi:MAG TPA: class I SAM-dependent methyltransferase, partial [Bacteroidota bacterium]|nr:class I SAM-dependent methyltransferase [Bacteroidota bacterium]
MRVLSLVKRGLIDVLVRLGLRKFLVRLRFNVVAKLPSATDELADGYSRISEDLERYKQFVVDCVNDRSSKAVLDYGCGTGRYLQAIVQGARAPVRLAGIDISRYQLERARSRNLPNAEFVHLDASQNDVPWCEERKGTFDLVY